MTGPTVVDIPHKLGRAEARRRLEAGADKIFQHLPGGAAHVTSAWPSENRMTLDVKAIGQSASAIVEVEERFVRVSLTLPPMLSFMGDTIAGALRRSGEKLLLPDGRRPLEP